MKCIQYLGQCRWCKAEAWYLEEEEKTLWEKVEYDSPLPCEHELEEAEP